MAAAATPAFASASSPAGASRAGRAVFVQTDNTAGNRVVAYRRAADGTLTPAGSYATGGRGGILAGSVVDHTASQGSLTYDPRHGLLFAVNAGSNTISVFAVHGDRLGLREVLSSGGTFPVSVAVHGRSSAWSSATTSRCCGLAASFVPSRAVAEEVVQDTWLAMLHGLETFEGRSSLKTWLFRILVNRARSTGSKEQRSVPVADPGPAVDPFRFGGDGAWADPPEHWVEAAERRMEAGKLTDRIRAWIGELPARQREVVLLRDVEGMSSEEVCAVLALTDGNQRVLLHRGRAGSGSCSRTSSGRCDEAPAPVP